MKILIFWNITNPSLEILFEFKNLAKFYSVFLYTMYTYT